MAYHSLLSKVDRALVAYLISAGAGTSENIFHHRRAADLPDPPFITCFAESGDPEASPYSGVYSVRASIDVHTNAAPDYEQDTDTMESDSEGQVADTFDALHDLYFHSGDQLADLINTAASGAGIADLFIQNVKIGRIEQGRAEKDFEWIDTINLEIVCCPRQIA
jgi:hypothetical protein